MLVLLGLRYEGDIIEGLAAEVREMEESSTYQWIVRKGERRGVVNTILRQGRPRLGEPAPAVIEALQGVTDMDRLNVMCDRIRDVATWDELLATP